MASPLKKLISTFLFLLSSTVIMVASSEPLCHPYKSIISFGDSIADTGNYLRLSDVNHLPQAAFLPYGETFFHPPSGRYSDGRLIIDFIGTYFFPSLCFIHLGKTTCWINDVWRSSCSPKLRLFLWSIINNALPIGENLQNRGMISATNCPRCNEKETKMHIFFTCPFAKEVWNLVPISHAVHIAAGMDFTEALTRFRRTICLPPTGVVGAIVPWIVWSLWLSRNTLIFEDKKITPGETTTKGLRLALEWNQAQRKEIKDSSLPEESRDRVHTTSANSPMNGSTTCKTDAAWDKKRKRAGLAWNFSGPTIPSPVEGSLVQDFIASPLIAEALALMTALGSAKDLGITKLEVFSDCATLIGAIDYLKELLQRINDLHTELESTAPPSSSSLNPLTPTTQTLSYRVKEELCPSSSFPSPRGEQARIEVKLREGKAVNIHMFCGRRPGLLLSTMRALDNLGLDVQQAVVSCFNGFALDVFRAEQCQEGHDVVPEQIKAVLLDTVGYTGLV